MYPRELKLPVGEQSCFLFGPRQTGKTTYMADNISNIPRFDVSLLSTDLFLKYSRDPSLFRKEVEYWAAQQPGGVVVVDEIQKLPILLDEIHQLIERLR